MKAIGKTMKRKEIPSLREPRGTASKDHAGKEESHNSFEHNWWQEAKGRGHVKMKDLLHEFNDRISEVMSRN